MNVHCCKKLKRNLINLEGGLVYFPKFREYGIRVLDGGSSSIIIDYCPWCGRKLPSSLRDQWFRELSKLKLEPGDRRIPKSLLSDEWWLKKKC